jgi:Raf kinase inhibitor-like YbhB/YbcL family protein
MMGPLDQIPKENTLTVTSPAFKNGGYIPARYTGFGEDISPELRIKKLPGGTQSLAVTMEDLDVPLTKSYPHWVIWNLPPDNVIPENIPRQTKVASLGAVQGMAFGEHCYRGPFPIFGNKPHRYIFTVYALDCALDIYIDTMQRDLMHWMNGHILGKGQITALYQKSAIKE